MDERRWEAASEGKEGAATNKQDERNNDTAVVESLATADNDRAQAPGTLRRYGWLAVIVLVVAGFGINSARATACNNNRQDRFEQAFRTSSAMSGVGIPPAMAFDMGVKAADDEHPTLWYCFGSDR